MLRLFALAVMHQLLQDVLDSPPGSTFPPTARLAPVMEVQVSSASSRSSVQAVCQRRLQHSPRRQLGGGTLALGHSASKQTAKERDGLSGAGRRPVLRMWCCKPDTSTAGSSHCSPISHHLPSAPAATLTRSLALSAAVFAAYVQAAALLLFAFGLCGEHHGDCCPGRQSQGWICHLELNLYSAGRLWLRVQPYGVFGSSRT